MAKHFHSRIRLSSCVYKGKKRSAIVKASVQKFIRRKKKSSQVFKKPSHTSGMTTTTIMMWASFRCRMFITGLHGAKVKLSYALERVHFSFIYLIFVKIFYTNTVHTSSILPCYVCLQEQTKVKGGTFCRITTLIGTAIFSHLPLSQ